MTAASDDIGARIGYEGQGLGDHGGGGGWTTRRASGGDGAAGRVRPPSETRIPWRHRHLRRRPARVPGRALQAAQAVFGRLAGYEAAAAQSTMSPRQIFDGDNGPRARS